MDHVLGHIVRRGVEAHSAYKAAKPDGEDQIRLPAWGLTCLAITGVAFVYCLAMIEYTYGHVVATLAMVESPATVLFEVLPGDEPDAPLDDEKKMAAPFAGNRAELVVMKQEPITSSLGKTIRHLRSQAGYFSRFRGLSLWIVYRVVMLYLSGLLGLLIPNRIAVVISAVILAQLNLSWTHVVITEASPKYWFRRLAARKLLKKVLLPTLILAVCKEVAVAIPVSLVFAFGLNKGYLLQTPSKDETRIQLAFFYFVVVTIVAFLSVIMVVIPAATALTRVQASLVSEEEETIVPFDRTFGGLVLNGGAIGMLDAWKTFDWNSRMRLAKVYLKTFAMQMALVFFFVVATAVEVAIILGADGPRLAAKINKALAEQANAQ